MCIRDSPTDQRLARDLAQHLARQTGGGKSSGNDGYRFHGLIDHHKPKACLLYTSTQQQSDTTYRLYDYGRPRELHLKEGLAAVKLKGASGKVVRPAPARIAGSNNRRAPLVAAPYFVVDMFEMKDCLLYTSRCV